MGEPVTRPSTYYSTYYPGKELQIPRAELRPSRLVLIPELACSYNLETDTMRLMLNGVPMDGVDVQAADYHEACEQLTRDIWGLVRKLIDLHKSRAV